VTTASRTTLLILLILVQSLCALFFLSDVMADSVTADGRLAVDLHLATEGIATIGLICGIYFETRYLRDLIRQSQKAEQNVRVATGALNEVIQEYFRDWGLTPSERDVAMFAIKGMSNAEIAGLRASSEGTIKAHLNAVFRKAGVSGRNQLVSLLVEDLMGAPLIGGNLPVKP